MFAVCCLLISCPMVSDSESWCDWWPASLCAVSRVWIGLSDAEALGDWCGLANYVFDVCWGFEWLRRPKIGAVGVDCCYRLVD